MAAQSGFSASFICSLGSWACAEKAMPSVENTMTVASVFIFIKVFLIGV
jgi:hypothetical protein